MPKEPTIAAHALWPVTGIRTAATVNLGMGSDDEWRTPEILADATVALLVKSPAESTFHAWLDEEILSETGVTDFDQYACVPGSKPEPMSISLWTLTGSPPPAKLTTPSATIAHQPSVPGMAQARIATADLVIVVVEGQRVLSEVRRNDPVGLAPRPCAVLTARAHLGIDPSRVEVRPVCPPRRSPGSPSCRTHEGNADHSRAVAAANIDVCGPSLRGTCAHRPGAHPP